MWWWMVKRSVAIGVTLCVCVCVCRVYCVIEDALISDLHVTVLCPPPNSPCSPRLRGRVITDTACPESRAMRPPGSSGRSRHTGDRGADVHTNVCARERERFCYTVSVCSSTHTHTHTYVLMVLSTDLNALRFSRMSFQPFQIGCKQDTL